MLKKDQQIELKSNFKELVSIISNVQDILQRFATKSVNQFLTLRNWMFGYYIVEYEQNGDDRAKYGENLMQEIANKLTHIKGLRFRQLFFVQRFLPNISSLFVRSSRKITILRL